MYGSIMAPAPQSPGLLSLPYDIRCIIYRHLLPNESQIYLTVGRDQKAKTVLYPMHARADLSMTLCRVSRQLNQEFAAYVYTNYLFNIVGKLKELLLAYKPILLVMQKYARTTVQHDIYSNGPLSSTACVSIYATGGVVQRTVVKRQRGILRDWKEVEEEVALASSPDGKSLLSAVNRDVVAAVTLAVAVAFIGLYLRP
jgi:hypothetical protein